MKRIWLMSWVLALVSGLPLIPGLPQTSLAEEPAKGWHGELLPAGLIRGEAEGEYIWQKDDSVMVYVPAGPFLMGSELEADEQPVREVELDAFYIDKYEISWGQWKASGLPYSKALNTRRGLPEPPDWGILDDHPMINVDWHQATEYAAKTGKRLPTEAEWEKAARGTDGRTWPWGNEPPTFERAIWRDHPTSKASTAEVTCCAAGASPYGVHNMAGNVYEWCADTYDGKFYQRAPKHNPVNRESGRFRVLRGGAFVLEAEDMRSAYRYRLLPVDRGPYIGFRTALSARAGEKK